MFKVGDIVKVRGDLDIGVKYGGMFFNRSMDEFKGKEVEVSEISIGVKGCTYWFSDEMLIPLSKVEDDEIPMVQKQGDGNVVHPSHYNKGIETIDYIESWDMNFDEGNIIKYVTRAKYKGKELEDLKKAAFYLDRLIYLAENKGE